MTIRELTAEIQPKIIPLIESMARFRDWPAGEPVARSLVGELAVAVAGLGACLEGITEQRDGLLAACKAALPRMTELTRYRRDREGGAFAQDFDEALETMKAAIAAAEGGAG